MDVNTAKRLTEALVQEVTIEINSIKSHVVADIIMQMAIYSHDHIGAHTMTFGVLSESPSLNRKCLEELDQVRAVLLDREQRRNALRHLMHLIEEGNEEAVHLLQEELLRFFSEDETYEFLLEPESEYPNEYVKPYLDSE